MKNRMIGLMAPRELQIRFLMQYADMPPNYYLETKSNDELNELIHNLMFNRRTLLENESIGLMKDRLLGLRLRSLELLLPMLKNNEFFNHIKTLLQSKLISEEFGIKLWFFELFMDEILIFQRKNKAINLGIFTDKASELLN